eukprot:503696_1
MDDCMDDSSEDNNNKYQFQFKCVRSGFDGSYHNKVYARNSLNGCVTFIDIKSRKVIHFDTRTKHWNYPKHGVSGNMERDMARSGIIYLNSKMIHPNDLSIDGDAKIPPLVEAINKIASELFSGLPVVKLSSDIAHSKKNMVTHVFQFKSDFDWTGRKNEYDLRGFTFEYCKLLIDRWFQYAFHEKSVTTVSAAIDAVRRQLIHLMPNDALHSECAIANFDWCKTLNAGANNRSSHLNTGDPAKYGLPIGIREEFDEWLFKHILQDRTIQILLKPGCTSLNESCNHVINDYTFKKRLLGGLGYAHMVARGVLQWNNPFRHLMEELEIFGIVLSPKHKQMIENRIKKKNKDTIRSRSHKNKLKKHRKKYAIRDSSYVGGGKALFGDK